MKEKPRYCTQVITRACGHKVERIPESLALPPLVWWCKKCKRSLTDDDVEVKP